MNKKFWSEFVDVVPKGSLPVYEIDKTEVRPEMVYELAKRFEMEGEMLKKDDEYIMAQKKRVLTVYRNTGLSASPILPSSIVTTTGRNCHPKTRFQKSRWNF